jgi:hypothetical protein
MKNTTLYKKVKEYLKWTSEWLPELRGKATDEIKKLFNNEIKEKENKIVIEWTKNTLVIITTKAGKEIKNIMWMDNKKIDHVTKSLLV